MKLKQYILISAFAFLGGIVGGLLFCQFAIGTAAIAETGIAKEIKAEKFTLVNKAGKIFAILCINNDKYPSFSMADPSGLPAIVLTADGEYNSMVISGVGGEVTLVRTKNFGALKMSEIDSNEVWIYSGKKGTSIELTDKSSNKAILGNCDLENTRADTVISRPASSLVLFNKNGDVVWETPE